MKNIKLLTFSLIFLLFAFSTTAQCKTYLTDNAGLLTENEKTLLEQKLSENSENLSVDIAVYTENAMTGSDAQSTAENLYDSLGYGYGENRDGILFYISMDEREYYLDTYGESSNRFGEDGQIYIEEKILEHLGNGEYYDAFMSYADAVDFVLTNTQNDDNNNNYYSEDGEYADYYEQAEDKHPSWLTFVVLLGIPALVAFIMTRVKQGKMKTAVLQNTADSYIKNNSVNITKSRDIFLFSTVTKTPIPQNDNHSSGHSSGGFSGGSSSGGHSGRGGSF